MATSLAAGGFLVGGCTGDDPPARTVAGAGPPAEATVGEPARVGRSPSALAVGGGAVWVVDATAGTLSRLDQATLETTRRLRVPGGPLAVAVGEGAAWVAAGDGTVRAVDPSTGRPTGAAAQVPGANGIAAGAGGIWVTSRLAGTVTRVDPRSRQADPAIRVGRGPADVAVDAGAVWVLNADDGTVTRIDTEGAGAPVTIRVNAPKALALAAGEDGIWVARASGEFGERVEIVRIDPDTRALAGEAIPVPGAVPLDLAVTDGSVWSTDAGDLRRAGSARTGGVVRIDAASGAVAGPVLRTGTATSAVAAVDGSVWVASAGDGTVTRIDEGPRAAGR